MHHPVLQPDQLALQPQQLVEIVSALDAVGRRLVMRVDQLRQALVVELELAFLVEAVEDLVVNARLQVRRVLRVAHGRWLRRLQPELGRVRSAQLAIKPWRIYDVL